MRVGLLNDILRFNYDLYAIFFYVIDNRLNYSMPVQHGNERDVRNVGRDHVRGA